MSESDKRSVAQQSAHFADAVQAMISRSCIVDFGVILSVPAKGIVKVGISAAVSNQDIKVITCVYANIASDNLTLDITPTEGDKVLVVYPKRYSSKMFDTEQSEVIIDKNAYGYNLMSGIAIPMNQYRTNQHHNVINFAEGGMELKLGFDGEKNSVALKVNSDGTLSTELNEDESFTVNNGVIKYTKGNNYVEFNLSTDGTVKVSDSSGTSIISKSDGITLEDKNGCTITSSSSSIKINGKLEIKK